MTYLITGLALPAAAFFFLKSSTTCNGNIQFCSININMGLVTVNTVMGGNIGKKRSNLGEIYPTQICFFYNKLKGQHVQPIAGLTCSDSEPGL